MSLQPQAYSDFSRYLEKMRINIKKDLAKFSAPRLTHALVFAAQQLAWIQSFDIQDGIYSKSKPLIG
jgi:hypothetical protein